MIRFLISFLILTNWTSSADFKGEVNVYSHRHYEIDKKIFERFTEKTEIKVNVVKANADQLIKRLEIEGQNSPADVLITVDAGRLFRAKQKGLLQPIESKILNENIPAHLRDPEGYWHGLSMRARVIAYSKDRVDPRELSTYEDLTDKKWQGRILVRSSQNIYNQSLLASMIASKGPEKAKDWAQGIVANLARKPKGNDRDQIKAIAAGIGDVAIVNTYYIGKMLNSENPAERRVAKMVDLFFPNQNGRGTHINVSGAGVTAHAAHKKHAVKFLEYLVSEEAQKLFAEANYEYPVGQDVERGSLVRSWGDFKADDINLSLLGQHNRQAVEIFDEVGWR
ncbi:Fe(3+) ABC transporter substrate-binding protein [candidate division KSB1 bacterium]|nr:Fe(3+) ABC transporter substrate-binding protein [candidate division KSB1 bacterium]NIR70522.1 Fe(3+) ABC transporter substrate-binding protein [candidate division KSB1 bacterium]NIS26195.1 Fe(3+) ABC transporter substrate-binding protein [candidate division KSB1 bacterium]NIT72973.1 Fe(3+) ABC transporter substrate-binding protein [candidate division KSB1 bacterium]NIU26842.1 Fe(3+) ABC transporter substrate-binding protein [candidate division KSB1 bacterium]